MAFLDLFRRATAQAPFCLSCAAKDNEIVYLRQHVDSLMDRLLCTVNLFQAQKDALEGPIMPETTPAPPEDEAEAVAREEHEQDTIFAEAEREIDRATDELGVPKGTFADL